MKLPYPEKDVPSLVTTFGEKEGVELKSSKDLMDWIVWGDDARFFKEKEHGGTTS